MQSVVNLELVLTSLEELSDRAVQEKLWLAATPGEMSSPTEAIEGLFTDSGLGDALDWAWRQRRGGREVSDAPTFSADIDKQLNGLRQMLRALPSGPDVIDAPAMHSVRAAAGKLLQEIETFAVENPGKVR